MIDQPPAGAGGPGQWRPADPARDQAAVQALVDAAIAVDGVAAVSGHVLEAVSAGRAALLTVADGSGYAGVAVALGDDPAEVVVVPDARRRGLGTALVRAAIERQPGVWAYGDLPAAAAVAGRLGLVRGRGLVQLRRTLPVPDAQTPDPVPPPGVRLRSFRPGDEDQIVAVNARAFSWHPEQGAMTRSDLDEQMAQDWFDPDGLIVAVLDDAAGSPSAAGDSTGGERIVGFHWTKVHPVDPTPRSGPAGPIGEIYVLAADPAAGLRGLGGPLTAAGLAHLAGRGLATVMLYTEADNERALALYRRFGFELFVGNVVYGPPTS